MASGDKVDMKPITGISGRCASAKGDHAAAPPSRVTRSRSPHGYPQRGSHGTTPSDQQRLVHHSKFGSLKTGRV